MTLRLQCESKMGSKGFNEIYKRMRELKNQGLKDDQVIFEISQIQNQLKE